MHSFKTLIKELGLLRPYLERRLFPVFLKYTRKAYVAPPSGLSIAVNNTCNMKCIMCDIGQKRQDLSFYRTIKGSERTDEMSVGQFIKLIDDVKKYRPSIYINATEPLLYRGLVQCLEYAIAHKLRCSLTTNGLLLEKFAHKLVEVGLTEMWVSIDGPAEVHDHIRGVNRSFEKAYNGIAMIIEKKRQLEVNAPILGVAYCISNHNFEHLVETAYLFKQTGINRMVFSHLNFVDEVMALRHNEEYGHIFNKLAPSSISASDASGVNIDVLTEQIKELKRDYAGFISFLPDIETREQIETYYREPSNFVISNRCKIAWRNPRILANGDVIVAARCGFSPIMGNIAERPLTKIWNDKPYREFRRKINLVGATPACSRCCSIFGD